MKTVLVQIGKKHIYLTGCEPVKLEDSAKGKRIISTIPYRFTPPYVMPLQEEELEGKTSLWEAPNVLAAMVKNGLRQMKNPEIKEAIIITESFDLITQEFQHFKSNKKVLTALAVSKIEDLVPNNIQDYSIITCQYSEPRDVKTETTTKAFAMSKALTEDLAAAFKDNGLNLIKIAPLDTAMIHASGHALYSFDRTVALVSADYTAIRILIAKNNVPLYCHSFHSPIADLAEIVARDKGISFEEAIDHIRLTGFGLAEECNTPLAQRQIEGIKEDIEDEIVKNVRIVLMSLNISLDQILLSDIVGCMPRITNYIRTLGICKDVEMITDTFNSQTVVPELSIKARDDFYKTGAFFLFNEFMNGSDRYKHNLLTGLNPTKAKTIHMGKRITTAACIVLGLAMVGIGGLYGYLLMRQGMDAASLQNPKYTVAKKLIAEEAEMEQKIDNQNIDKKLLPRSAVTVEEVIRTVNEQVVKKVMSISGYNISHQRKEKDQTESIGVPVSGRVRDFRSFIDTKDSISKDGYFEFSKVFHVAEDETNNCYTFSATLNKTVNMTEDKEQDTAQVDAAKKQGGNK